MIAANPEIETALEEYVDQAGLADVLQALANICYGKSEHLLCNWQDKTAAKDWEKAGSVIEKASMRIPILP